MSEGKVKKVNKMKIAVISLASALVLAVGGMVGIYAANQQTVGASFTVKYSIGDNVAVAVGAMTTQGYWDTSMFVKASWFDGKTTNGNGTISPSADHGGLYILNATEVQDRGFVLENDDISFQNVTGKLCLIMFCFENLSDSAIECTITDNCDISPNMNVGYDAFSYSYDDETFAWDDLQGRCAYQWEHAAPVPPEYFNGQLIINPGQMGFFLIEMTVTDENKSAYYKSEGENCLSFSFQQYSE